VALAAPKKEGFNLVGYLLPFVAIVAAGAGVAVTASRWARRGGAALAAPLGQGSGPGPAGGALAEKLRKELDDFEG